ncbi:peptidyl-prolyl cis-trans isomerase CYP57 [Silene latifolia]|uniref:peptidyl-prolyl cis-trans isomerase CYP57 n=1 Tax=Silene latifolia TaxID=37657 RepID=UPI003D779B85
MSAVYVLEPPTKGKVVLNTSYGPIDIELWPKEAPKASRNFVQLCLEGYYDNTIFHRIIKGFLVQGGDPTSTGVGGESIYGGPFSDEFHSRLRFNHRGLVACANAGSPHSNGSQFFMTLDRCEWLDKKNTIFGKVTGDSIFNLLRIGEEIETDSHDRPLDPAPKITSVEVIWNPFDDMVPRETHKKLPEPVADTESKSSKKKAVKKLNLLSFGEEAEEEEKDLAAVKQKIKSSHDVLDDPRLLKEGTTSKELNPDELKNARELQLSVREALSSKKEVSHKETADKSRSFSDSEGNDDDDEAGFDARMRKQILRRRTELGDVPTKQKSKSGGRKSRDQEESAPTPRSDPESADEQRKVAKLAIKKKGIGSEARAERMVNADTDLQMLNNAERDRYMHKEKKRRLRGREDDVLAKLDRFKESLNSKHEEPLDKPEGGSEHELAGWAKVQLKFAPDSGKSTMSRTEDVNDYAVVDPLLKNGKQKFNKMIAKQKRREREWAGRPLT